MSNEVRATRNLSIAGAGLIMFALAFGLAFRWPVVEVGDQEVLAEFIEHRMPWITSVMEAITWSFNPLSAVVLSGVLGLAVWWLTKQKHNGLYILASVFVSAVITHGMKFVVHRSRPPLYDQLITEVDYSFPSGHATAAAAIATSLAMVLSLVLVRNSQRALIWVLAFLLMGSVGISRLYLGVHWFTDVSAGLLIGLGTALMLSFLIRLPRTVIA